MLLDLVSHYNILSSTEITFVMFCMVQRLECFRCTYIVPWVAFETLRLERLSFYHLGVVEYLSSGAVSEMHTDLKQLTYSKCLSNFSCSGNTGKPNGSVTHNFHLKSAYGSSLMPYTNYTYFFKVCLLKGELQDFQPGPYFPIILCLWD